MKNKGIRQQILENKDYLPMDTVTEEDITRFLEDFIDTKEYPDDMEIFTVDRGWHKAKDYK